MNQKYNGWTNRETWLVNIWFGDFWETAEDVEASREQIETEIQALPNWIQDFIYEDSINWDELKESVDEVEQPN